MTRYCADCDRPFTPAKSFHRNCWSCWKQGQDRAVEDQAYHRGYADGLRDAHPPTQGMDPALAKRAALLCHPDRHPKQREREATEITAALLDIANGKQPRVETRSLP